jgi:zinc transport system ATP-binding protein
MKPIIKIKGLTAAYEDNVIFTNADLTVYNHDFLVMIGPNGGGKTTLIRYILGLKKPLIGTITYFKNDTQTSNLTMGYLPQYNAIDKKFPVSVEEVVLSGLNSQKKLWKRFTAEQHEQVKKVIKRMGLNGIEDKTIGELSGGQIQRALLGRAIVSNPDVVILDEPSTYIDKEFQSQLYKLLQEINKDSAIILVSHDVNNAIRYATRIVYINHGVEEKNQTTTF